MGLESQGGSKAQALDLSELVRGQAGPRPHRARAGRYCSPRHPGFLPTVQGKVPKRPGGEGWGRGGGSHFAVP